MKTTNIFLDEKDKMDMNALLKVINTCGDLMSSLEGKEEASEEQILAYYKGCAKALVEAKVSLHLLRKEFSSKYNVPYNAVYRDGEILIVD